MASASAEYVDWSGHGFDVNPDVVKSNPANALRVTYDGKHFITPGEILSKEQAKHQPTLDWPLTKVAAGATPQLYTVLMVDPDAPSRKDPKYRNWLHWGLVNVTDPHSLGNGFSLTEGGYMGPAPPPKTGLHRYCFLVYAQKGVIEGGKLSLVKDGDDGMGRGGWSLDKFLQAHQYELDAGVPHAGNFFQCQNATQ